jgi:putative glutamine amidotransferase
MHDVEVEAGTLMRSATGAETLSCSSHHHQGVDRVGDGLRVSARSADGLVEGLEVVDGPTGWTVAVQWHPEDTAEGDPRQQGLFDELVRRAAR